MQFALLTSYIINSQSDMKDEAWEFIKYVSIDKEMLDNMFHSWNLPAKESVFRDVIVNHLIKAGPWFYHYDSDKYASMDDRAERAEYQEWLVELEKEFIEPANEFADRLESVVRSLDSYRFESTIDVRDEYNSLATGVKTVEQLAQVLQEKYTLYLSQ